MMRSVFAAVVLLLSTATLAIDTELAFEDAELQARYERLIAEVRCVTCQNQNIRDSNAFIASDLRREIRRLLHEGKTDKEVMSFLVERYGDFVLYRPRTDGAMALVWLVPLVLLLFALFGVVRVVRHRMTMPVDDDSGELR